ncbi:MAG: hypothetical protein ABH860_04135 [bacterium]
MNLQAIIDPVLEVANTISPLLINLIISLVLLLISIVIAKGLQTITVSVLKAVMLDKGLSAIGFTPFLTKGEIKKAPSDLLGDMVYWILIFIAVTAVAMAYGPSNSKELLSMLLAYSVSVIAAVFIMALSVFLSVVIAGIVTAIANNVGLSNTKTLAKIAQYGVNIFGFLKALEILGISSAIIVASFSVIVGAVGLAFAIAFGLGCKDIAADFVTSLFKGK